MKIVYKMLIGVFVLVVFCWCFTSWLTYNYVGLVYQSCSVYHSYWDGVQLFGLCSLFVTGFFLGVYFVVWISEGMNKDEKE